MPGKRRQDYEELLMNIVVCVKQVPDTAVERKLTPEGTLDRASLDGLINELDEYAIEEGLKIAEAHGGEVTILSMGPDKAAESVRKALSMGAKKPVQVLSLADLAVDGGQVGLAGAATRVDDFAARPPRSAGVIVRDEGDGGAKAAGFLAGRKFI